MRLRRTLAILFLGQSLLFGAVYSSNALMQTLEILPQAPSEGYYIITDGSTDTLYLDGESVCTLTRSGDTEIRSDASGVTTRVFDGDRLVSVTGPDGEEKRYEYSDDGILERVTTYSDGQAVRVIQYSYAPQTGLSAVIDLSDASASFYSGTEMTYRDGETVRVVDSLSVAVGEYILVEYAHRLLAKGETLDEVARKLEEKKRKVRLMALLGTLKYLRKGGRISAIASVSGELLNIKPVVAVVDGEVKLAGKAVGSKKGNNLLNKMIENTSGIDFAMPYGCVYSGLDSTVLDKYIADCSAIWKGHVDDIPRRMIGATIGTHIGPGAIAVAFFEK